MNLVLSELLEGKKTVALGGHVHPDGDCIGSTTALYTYIQEQYPDIHVDLYLESVPMAFDMITKARESKNVIPEGKIYDLFICMDCGDEKRLGFSAPLFESAKHTVCIDHHKSNDAFADINYIFPKASSTSELVYGLLDKDKISYTVAEALYMGIVHDTGVFQYSCTSPETMIAGADLLSRGINGSEIIDKTYYEKTFVQNKMLGKALMNSTLILDGRCIVSVLEKDEMDALGGGPQDTEGVVSQLRLTQGTEAAVFLYGTGDNTYKLSLRSKAVVDVSAICKDFGGGGHARAAGATVKGDIAQILDVVSKKIEEQLTDGEV